MDHTEVKFSSAQADTREVLVALLSDAGYTGFEETGDTLTAYIPAEDFDAPVPQQLAEKFNLRHSIKNVPVTNWNALWESNFEPVIVDDFCVVRAHFHPSVENVLHDIVITPKMSFGTGHHATTYMMIQQMKHIPFSKKTVLDFGTGTGILAILAERSGAAEIIGIDNDQNSIDNAKENVAANNCSKISLLKADNAHTGKMFDVILANITRNVIFDNIHHFVNSLNRNGILLLSGLLEDDRQVIDETASRQGLRFENVIRREKWLCMKFTK